MTISLPEEIEREILELTARADPKSGFALLQVSRCVSQWTTAIIYETVVAGVNINQDKPGAGLQTSEIERYGIHVRHLLLGVDSTPADLELYLRSCPNITNLCVWKNFRFKSNILELLKGLRLKRFSAHHESLYDPTGDNQGDNLRQMQEAFSSLQGVTHLDIAGTAPIWLIPSLESIPDLTYLSVFNCTAIRQPEWIDGFAHIFKICPSLRVIVPLSERPAYSITEDEENLGAYRCDPRDELVDKERDGRVVGCVVDDYVYDWMRGIHGEPDLWEFALKNIRKR